MQAALGEPVDQQLLDEIAEEEARLQTESESRKGAFASIFADLSKDISKLMVEEKKKTAEEQALLDRFSSIVSKIKDAPPVLVEKEEPQEAPVEELVEPEVITPEVVEWVEVEVQSPSIASEPVVTKPEPKKKKAKSIVDAAVEHVSETTAPSMFVQPDPPLVNRDIKDIQQKLKLLEGWISKISMNGPGGGAVWLKDLDDVARSSIIGATDGQVLTYNDSIKKWTAQDPAIANGGYTLPTASTTVKGGVKIDGTTITIDNQVISANIPAQVQADWTQSNNTSVSFILNKPTIPDAQVNSDWNATSGVAQILNKPSIVTDITSVDNTVQISSNNGVHDLSVAASLSTSVDKVFAYVTNDDSVTIHKGDPVFLYRATGNRPSVIQAKNTGDAYSAKTLGLASQDIAPGNPGWVQTQGVLTGLDTSAYAEGDTLYLSSTAGVMTNIKPYAPNHLVYMGVVVRANQGQGQIYIKPQNGYELEELHNVNIDHNVVLANGHVLVYNTNNSLWENRSLSGLVAAYTANNTSFVGTVSAANVVSNSQLSSNLANYQTTAGLSANVATLTTNNSLYLGTKAANQYAYANGSNFSINNPVSISYTGATATGYALTLAGANTQGGIGYADFLRATNISTGATANSKSFRLTSSGTLEIINSAYTASLLGLSDAGDLSIAGKIQVAGKTAVNGPAFSAYAAAILQTIPTDAQTKVLFQTEEFDTASCYANSRFTPNVEGYYQLNAEVRIDGTSGTGEMMIILYKNGSEYKRGTNQSGTQIAASFWAMQVSSLVYANGTTDYFEIYVQHGAGASRTVTAVNNSAITWFNGSMMRGA